MESKKILEDWLSVYVHQHDVPFNASTFKTSNANGVMGIRYGAFDIVIEIDGKNFVYFHVRLMALPTIDQSSFLQFLLRLNLSCLQVKGSTLALDATQSFVLLCFRQCMETMDEQIFASLLSSFALHAEKLYEALKKEVSMGTNIEKNTKLNSTIKNNKMDMQNDISLFAHQGIRA